MKIPKKIQIAGKTIDIVRDDKHLVFKQIEGNK